MHQRHNKTITKEFFSEIVKKFFHYLELAVCTVALNTLKLIFYILTKTQITFTGIHDILRNEP